MAWKDSIIVWGGCDYTERWPARWALRNKVYQHRSGEWIRRDTRGFVPEPSWNVVVQVVGDRMIVMDMVEDDEDSYTIVCSLDLNSWTWIGLTPNGTPPSIPFFDGGTWVHNEKSYCFGGRDYNYTNQLFCYNPSKNSWEWPNQGGDIPTPRFVPMTIVREDTVFVLGGESIEGPQNDLYILDMSGMVWTKVHGNISHFPWADWYSCGTFTCISPSAALLYGTFWRSKKEERSAECWLLDLDKANELQEASPIWTRIPNHYLRRWQSAVVEPISQRLWVIGGHDKNNDATSDVLEVSFNLLPLKILALDHVAQTMDEDDARLQSPNCPKGLKTDIDHHRSNLGMTYVCSAETGCLDCQPAVDQPNM